MNADVQCGVEVSELSQENQDYIMRKMRDGFFQKQTSDENWIGCRENWRPTFAAIIQELASVNVKLIYKK